MESRTTRQFRRALLALPATVQNDAKRAYLSFLENLRMLVCNLRRSKGRMIFTWCESVLVIEREEFCGGIGLSGTGSVVTLSTIDLFSLGYAPGYTLAFTVISLAGCRTPRMWRMPPLRIGRIRACFHLKPQMGTDPVNGRKGEFVSFGETTTGNLPGRACAGIEIRDCRRA